MTSGYECYRKAYDNLTAVARTGGGDLIQGVSHGYAAGKTIIGNDHRFIGKSRVSPVLLVTQLVLCAAAFLGKRMYRCQESVCFVKAGKVP